MGLLSQDQHTYYKPNNSANYGNYQFVTLDDIITNFMYTYVGESKLITKVNRTDVQFHGMRAIQELSYDILRSHKSQEIEVPNTLQMILPQDYVNYTKVTRVDGNGIERVLYPTGKTSNPFAIAQNGDGTYDFGFIARKVTVTIPALDQITEGDYLTLGYKGYTGSTVYVSFRFDVDGSALNTYSNPSGSDFVYGIAVNGLTDLQIAEKLTGVINDFGHHTATRSGAVVTIIYNETLPSTPSSEGVFKANGTSGSGTGNLTSRVIVSGTAAGESIVEQAESDTWGKFKTQSTGDPYADDTSDLFVDARGRRYGLDPQSAQSNGSFYIDNGLGLLHFGSSLVNQTIILHYISDGLGTDSEMIVHKFCEEAVYKWIMYGILSGRSGMPEGVVLRFKKERFAETRKAKIRLSNIKMEEFTQVLKGISKPIK